MKPSLDLALPPLQAWMGVLAVVVICICSFIFLQLCARHHGHLHLFVFLIFFAALCSQPWSSAFLFFFFCSSVLAIMVVRISLDWQLLTNSAARGDLQLALNITCSQSFTSRSVADHRNSTETSSKWHSLTSKWRPHVPSLQQLGYCRRVSH